MTDEFEFRLTKKKHAHTKRGFVMTGGGAKGLYEAGVLQAFHLAHMKFDVITGSSIGAINSVGYAEYLMYKPRVDPKLDSDRNLTNVDDILSNINEKEDYINALHTAWLEMPSVGFIDDGNTGALGHIKDDLLEFDVDLPMLVRLLWWWTTPDDKKEPWPLTDILKLVKELLERVGASGMLRIIGKLQTKQAPMLKVVLDTYLEKMGIQTAFVTPDSEQKLREHFTKEHIPLSKEILEGNSPPNKEKVNLLPESRTFKEYHEEGIDVRLTRANFRTGLLEISAYISKEAFAQKITNYWRFEVMPEEGFPVTNWRIELPGNPVVIDAALASSRYPAVFSPYPFEKIYPRGDENDLLYSILENGFSPEVQDVLLANQPDYLQERLKTAFGWLTNKHYESFTGRFFPKEKDRYIDGGSIDNTPTNSAVDAIREKLFIDQDMWRRDATLDLYTVLLHKLPAQKEDEAKDPSMFDVVKRTLEINSAAKLTTDATYAETIANYGNKAEQLAELLLVLLEAIYKLDQKSDSSLEIEELYEQIREVAHRYNEEKFKEGYRLQHFKILMDDPQGEKTEEDAFELLSNIKKLCERWLERGLPLDLNVIKIHPDEMPLHTVAFTERLGYDRENGLEMITMGCYNTLWDLRVHLQEKAKYKLDANDKCALLLTQKWIGHDSPWPDKNRDDIAKYHMELRNLRKTWKCQRTECIFHRKHCAHGHAQHSDD